MSTNTTSRRLSFLAILTPILFVAVWLRLAALQEPVWLDELHTSWCVSSSFFEAGPRAMEGNQTPFYFWLVWPVYQGLGETAFALRLVSLVASLSLVASIGSIVFRWSGSIIGATLAAGLAAIDDKFLFYAVEARPYVVVQLAAVWQVYLFARILFPKQDDCAGGASNRSRTSLAIFWLLTNVLVWLHPTTIVLLFSESVIFFCLVIWRSWNQWSQIWKFHYPLIPFLGLLALTFPALFVFAMFHRRLLWEAFVDPNTYLLLTVADWLTCIAAPSLALLFCARQQHESLQGTGLIVVVVLLSAFGPLLVTWMHWMPLADYRYTIAAATMVPVLAGVLIGLIKRNKSRLLIAAIVTGLAVATNPLLPGLIRGGRLPSQRVEQWDEIINTINSDGLPVCLYPNLVEDARLAKQAHRPGIYHGAEYLQFAVRGIYPVFGLQRVEGRVETLSLISPQAPSNSMMERFEESGGGWVLIRARQSDMQRVLNEFPEWFGSKWQIEYEDFSLPPLYLYRVQLKTSIEPASVPADGNQ